MKIIFAISFFIFSTLFAQPFAKAENLRATSFEERPICEKNRGVWREFGNICADNCEYKFDSYAICSKATTFSCDCGPQKCWHDQKCVSTKNYKTIYDKESEKENEELAQKRKEREEKIKNDPNMRAYLSNIYGKKTDVNNAAGASADGAGAVAAGAPASPALQQPQANSAQAQLPSTQSLIQQNQERAITQVPAQVVTQVPAAQSAQAATQQPQQIGGATQNSANDRQEKVPPFFAKQEQAKQEASAKQNGKTVEETIKFPEIPVPR